MIVLYLDIAEFRKQVRRVCFYKATVLSEYVNSILYKPGYM